MLPDIKRILYATDLSESARTALAWALSLARKYDASITTIHVMPDLVEAMSGQMGYDLSAHFEADKLARFNEEGFGTARESVINRIRSVCRDVQDELPECDLDLDRIVIKAGHPVSVITTEVEEGDYDLVVMGQHGHGLVESLLLGSVARGVVAKSPKPVLTIKLPS
jgi:nucleotide-binding universal stress UspA family protein